jgi:hypothetical protein
MNIGYLIYQAERPMSGAEQRAADDRRGELAAALSRWRRRGRQASPVTSVTATGLATSTTALPAVPDCACALDFQSAHS